VGDDVVADAGVDVGGEDAFFDEVGFGAVGAEAYDAAGPCGGHSGDMEELGDCGVVDVDWIEWGGLGESGGEEAECQQEDGPGGWGAHDSLCAKSGGGGGSFRRGIELRSIAAQPSHKNKDVARVGHPEVSWRLTRSGWVR